MLVPEMCQWLSQVESRTGIPVIPAEEKIIYVKQSNIHIPPTYQWPSPAESQTETPARSAETPHLARTHAGSVCNEGGEGGEGTASKEARDVSQKEIVLGQKICNQSLARETHSLSKKPCRLAKESSCLSKEPYILSKEPYRLVRKPYSLSKETCRISKELYSLQKEPITWWKSL